MSAKKIREMRDYQKAFYIDFFLENGRDELETEKVFRKRFKL